MKHVLILVAALAIAAAASPASMVGEAGTISGVVLDDSTKAPIHYANVILEGTDMGAMSLADGSFTITGVPPGTYVVKALMMGYKPLQIDSVVVEPNETVELRFALHTTIVTTTQEITVTADKPMVEVTSSDTRISSDQVESMPGDEVLEKVRLKAGGANSGDGNHIRGGRSGEVQIPIVDTEGNPVQSPPRPACRKRTTSANLRNQRGIVPHRVRFPHAPGNTETYDRIYENGFLATIDNPFSTFSIDVDRASYANIRRFLKQGVMPPSGAVRIEEMINYFSYDYPEPEGEHPFSITTDVIRCPWNEDNRIVRVGLQGRSVDTADLPRGNLVFLLDVSGSMRPANKLPLVRRSMRMLAEHLREEDRVAIVVYAGAAGLVLPSTPGSDTQTILDAIDRLQAGGSTAGAAGIRLAYEVAEANFVESGNNRVILATDGDFNVGASSNSELVRMIEEKRETGIFLTVLGFGQGNYKDARMEQLADKGNGNYAYVDDIHEARKVLITEMGGTLLTIAKDVKIQIEFNPVKVKSYRLIGYENRMLRKKDFDDDRKDAGELGAGHSVTALYEIVPAGENIAAESDPKYVAVAVKPEARETDELLTVRFRYKRPDEEESRLIEQTLADADVAFADAPEDVRFAAAVASFGMLLRGSEFKGNATLASVLEIAGGARGEDEHGYRAEFVRIVETCQSLGRGR